MRFTVKSPSRHSFVSARRYALAVAGSLMLAVAIMPAAQAQGSDGAVYAVTYLDVGANAVGKGIDLLKKYRESSRQDGANLEFTVLQEASRPNHFVIVEGWKDQAAFEAHDKAAAKGEFQDALKPIRNSPPDRHVLHGFATAPAKAAPAGGALYMVEHVDFLPAFGPTAPPLIKALAEATQKEPGVVRYEIYQQPAPRTNHYTVVSVWTDAKAFDAHEASALTRQFRTATVYPGRANLYDQRLYKGL
jgi:quinol monooxygenase YgiN